MKYFFIRYKIYIMNKEELKRILIKRLVESIDIYVLTDDTESKIYDAIFEIVDDLIQETNILNKISCGIF